MYIMEKQGMVTECQCGFRRGWGTMDAVVCLEDEIRKAQINKETVVSVFFDVEKAYDMLWREGLMINFYRMGVRGIIFNWIKDFLKGRTIQVKIGTVLSSKQVAENGTPQASVHLHLDILQMLSSKATYNGGILNGGIHKVINFEEANRQRKCS